MIGWYNIDMCRNIKVLYNFDPPASKAEIHDAALQYVRKISGYREPSVANRAAFDRAVADIAKITGLLVHSLKTDAEPRNRAVEEARAKERAIKRFANG